MNHKTKEKIRIYLGKQQGRRIKRFYKFFWTITTVGIFISLHYIIRYPESALWIGMLDFFMLITALLLGIAIEGHTSFHQWFNRKRSQYTDSVMLNPWTRIFASITVIFTLVFISAYILLIVVVLALIIGFIIIPLITGISTGISVLLNLGNKDFATFLTEVIFTIGIYLLQRLTYEEILARGFLKQYRKYFPELDAERPEKQRPEPFVVRYERRLDDKLKKIKTYRTGKKRVQIKRAISGIGSILSFLLLIFLMIFQFYGLIVGYLIRDHFLQQLSLVAHYSTWVVVIILYGLVFTFFESTVEWLSYPKET